MLITRSESCSQGIDPFLQSLTMPSVCQEVYRKIFMPENTIALLPAFGYQKHDASQHMLTAC